MSGNGPVAPAPAAVELAKQQLVKVLMSFPMDGSALITSFVNVAIQSARIDALQDFLLINVSEQCSQSKQERFDALLAHHLNVKAQALAATLSSPRIALASAVAGHG